jgi:hypothetical protein
MKRFSISTRMFALVLTTTLIVSACTARIAPETTPTIDINQQVTQIAATFFSQVETQAAIPTVTATPMPPSPTATMMSVLDFNLTVPVLPTLAGTALPTPTTNPYANDPCVNQRLPDVLTGETIKIRIYSPVDRTINVSVYLQQNGAQGVCGYRSYVLPANDTLAINDLVAGCYSIWAWDPDPKSYFMVTNGTTCMDASQAWKFDINPNGSIKLH